MRQRRRNALFTFLYPGLEPGGDDPAPNAPYIAIPDGERWVSICGDGTKWLDGRECAVFYSPQALRDLADTLHEAADMLERNINE